VTLDDVSVSGTRWTRACCWSSAWTGVTRACTRASPAPTWTRPRPRRCSPCWVTVQCSWYTDDTREQTHRGPGERRGVECKCGRGGNVRHDMDNLKKQQHRWGFKKRKMLICERLFIYSVFSHPAFITIFKSHRWFLVLDWQRLMRVSTCCGWRVLLFLFVSDVADAPGDLEMSEQQARSVRLSWTAGSDHNSSITGTPGQIAVSPLSQQEVTITAL